MTVRVLLEDVATEMDMNEVGYVTSIPLFERPVHKLSHGTRLWEYQRQPQ